MYRASITPEAISAKQISTHLPTGDEPDEAIASDGAWYNDVKTLKVTLVPHSRKILKFKEVSKEMRNRQNQTYSFSQMGLILTFGMNQLIANTTIGIIQI